MSVALSYGNTIIRFGNVAISAGVVSPIYNVSLIQDAHGTIAASPMSGHPNQTVTLSNTPATHYHFDSYSVSGATLTGNQFKLVDQDVTAKGTFVEDDKYNLTLQTNGYGTISASKTTGYAGDTVTLSNTPSADCTFASYAATGATINGSTLTFGSQAATAKANFNRNVHSVTVQNDGHGTVTASPSTGYSGTQVTLNTTPASNYVLSGFTITGATLTGNKFNIGTSNVTAKAWFSAVPTYVTTTGYKLLENPGPLEDWGTARCPGFSGITTAWDNAWCKTCYKVYDPNDGSTPVALISAWFVEGTPATGLTARWWRTTANSAYQDWSGSYQGTFTKNGNNFYHNFAATMADSARRAFGDNSNIHFGWSAKMLQGTTAKYRFKASGELLNGSKNWCGNYYEVTFSA